MGGSSSYYLPSEPEAPLDCKDFANTTADLSSDLSVVRGYAVIPDSGFTEHWWCQTQRGQVVDVTSLAGLAPQYLSLAERSEVPTLICVTMAGACSVKPKCEWCVMRHRLEGKGLARASLRADVPRVVFDRLWERGRAVEKQLREEIKSLERRAENASRCSKCGGAGMGPWRELYPGDGHKWRDKCSSCNGTGQR